MTPQTHQFRRTQSLGTKMSFIMAMVVFVCTFAAVTTVLTSNLRQSVTAEKARLQSIGSVFRAVLSEPVANRDTHAAREALRALKDNPTIQQVSVTTMDGALIAEMGGGAVLDRKVQHSGEFTLLDLMSTSTLQISSTIVNGGTNVGVLRLTADISWLADQFRRHIAIAFAATGLAILVAFAGGTILIQRSMRSLSGLAEEVSDIGHQTTLTYQFKRQSDDEVGILVDAFNDMMHRIDVRDKALRKHSETLETTVTERTRELIIARDEAENANAAKSEFLAMMSHEIRTPMNGMMVMAQMLAAAPLSPRHLRFAEIINRSGQNLLAIINDVLDISKIEAGKLQIEHAPFSVDAILADIQGLFFERARERNVSLTYRIAPNVPFEMIGDAARLNQVITNLVNNALKFTERGGVTVTADAKPENGRMRLTIAVTDTGIGIAPDKLDQVFERFAQADQSITRRFGGTGLGLAISRRLVEAMDGTISVTSREGTGSTFTASIIVEAASLINHAPKQLAGFTFALDIPDAIERDALEQTLSSNGGVVVGLHDKTDVLMTTDAAKVAAATGTAFLLEPVIEASETAIRNRMRLVFTYPANRADLRELGAALHQRDFTYFRAGRRTANRAQQYVEYRGLRALAVDDNKVNRDVLREVLHSLGMVVEVAGNGEEAVAAASAERFDIIFMDCSMPVMDGFAATRIIRERERKSGIRVPVLAITALGRAHDQEWREAGMDGWITKPFTIPSVTSAISELVLKTAANEQTKDGAQAHYSDQFNSIPQLDEQTVSMIARIGAGGSSPQGQRIFTLFETHGATACESIALHFKASDMDALAESAKMLSSMATSIGAARLAAVSLDIASKVKAGEDVPAESIDTVRKTFKQSLKQVSSRLAVSRQDALAI